MTQAQRQESSAPPPPSSPPPVDTPALSKSTSPLQPALMGKPSSSSGHSLNLPVLETPKRKELPTLTDLLASSRKSKTRPRPPSRKLSSPAVDVTISSNYPNQHEAETRHNVLPVLLEDASVPDISPAKTYFSSPASGSAHSTPEHRRPRSPISPLFGTGGGNISMNMNISHFSPPFTSTQHGHGHEPGSGSSQYGGLGGESQRGHGLVRGSSGLFGMYNSQFDVEAQVGQVSDLLDRDVDFGEYLKDVDEDEEQEGKEEIAA
ncbi:hypothetical protein EUX98_g8423 [Antrodiella citrinella]|uniref:Uncharacterized protein n=1 Tax=Antrodiella citrinella TaxID=2447956 RepID=A0A4S4M7H1_9APHY|nr:hypothetical protein EUX98_g8423 [Antrodiella citrinella]